MSVRTMELTEDEICAIREMCRKIPLPLVPDYLDQVESRDRTMTDELATIFDENHKPPPRSPQP